MQALISDVLIFHLLLFLQEEPSAVARIGYGKTADLRANF